MKLKSILGGFLVIAGIVIGLWLGIWVMFIGGIAQLVTAFKVTPVSTTGIAFGLLRIMFSGFVGWLSGTAIVGCGACLSGR